MRERLTLQRISKAACPAGKAQCFLFDTDSPRLAVRITATGKKTFIFETKLDRQTIRWTIGACNAWKLDDARAEANRLQGLIDKGIDPREQEREEKAKKAAQKAEEERARHEAEHNKRYTLAALCEAYADHLKAQGKINSASAARSVVKCHVLEPHPNVAETPAREVLPRQIAEIIRMVIEKGRERTAGILRSTLAAAYNCGIRAPFNANLPSSFIPFEIETNPVAPVVPIPVKARKRTLNEEELKGYMAHLSDGNLIDQALKLALYAGGQRMAQLLRAEVKHYDPESKTLLLYDPKGKRKEPRAHLLPLAPVAAGIVAGLADRVGKDGYLFATGKTTVHSTTPGKRVAEISKLIGGEPFDLRDIRRTAETMLAAKGISREIRAQVLSHGISGIQATHYDMHEYIDEKRAALRRWERHLERIRTGNPAKVIKMQGGRGNGSGI
jgi:integrase